jgi:hypothetical protein
LERASIGGLYPAMQIVYHVSANTKSGDGLGLSPLFGTPSLTGLLADSPQVIWSPGGQSPQGLKSKPSNGAMSSGVLPDLDRS